MPYEFAEWDDEPEAQAGSSRAGGPPRKSVGSGVMDPPGPPSTHGASSLGLPGFASRVFAALILAALAIAVSAIVHFWFFPRP
ncbi:MAG TPA: hypothetical protein VMP12_04640 [Candidatus Sulfotelmatobacter sp.]|nr:hypothetical protein [Candidatus Sulfotelmatobacter sp.]